MTNLIKLGTFAILLVAMTITSCNSSKKTTAAGGVKTVSEGHIVYDISADGAAGAALNGSTMEIYFTPDNAKMAMNMMSGMMKIDMIVDNNKKEGLMLMDMMGQRKAAKMSKEELEEKEKEQVNKKPQKAEYINNYKTIAGYKCQEVRVTMDGLDDPAVVFVTEQIKPAHLDKVNMQFSGLKGFPLSWTIEQAGMKMTMVASKISLSKVDKKVFDMTIPSGYTETTIEEMQQMGGGMGL